MGPMLGASRGTQPGDVAGGQVDRQHDAQAGQIAPAVQHLAEGPRRGDPQREDRCRAPGHVGAHMGELLEMVNCARPPLRYADSRRADAVSATAKDTSMTAPSTSPVIPPKREVARRITSTPPSAAQPIATGPVHRPGPDNSLARAQTPSSRTNPSPPMAGLTVPATVAPSPSWRADGTGAEQAQAGICRRARTLTATRTMPRAVVSRAASAPASTKSTRTTAATPLGPMLPRRMTSRAVTRS